MYSLTCTVPPTQDVIDIVDVKRHLFVSDNDNNAHIRSLIAVAAAVCSQYCGRGWGVATWQYTIDSLPVWETLRLPLSPIVADSVSIQYYDTDNASQTLATSSYYVGLATGALAPVSTWPATRFRRPDAATITFQAGTATIPEQVKHAIKLIVGHYWANRGDEIRAADPANGMAMPAAARYLLDQARTGIIS